MSESYVWEKCAEYNARTCLRSKTDKPPAHSDKQIWHCTKPEDTLGQSHTPAIRLTAVQNHFKANQQLSILSLGPLKRFGASREI